MPSQRRRLGSSVTLQSGEHREAHGVIFFSEQQIREREEFVRRIIGGDLDWREGGEEFLRRYPDDNLALHLLSVHWMQEGDLARAEEYGWRALAAAPSRHQYYLTQAQIVQARDERLCDGLTELWLRKCSLLPPEEFQALLTEGEGFLPEDLVGGEPESVRRRFVAIANDLARGRSRESSAVRQRLRPYRLLHQLQDPPREGLDAAWVNRVLNLADECEPLLVGMLRVWAAEELGPHADFAARAALALLGEIGRPANLPILLEFSSVETLSVDEAAQWAIARIASRRPQEAFEQWRLLAPQAEPADRVVMARQVALAPRVPGGVDFVLAAWDVLPQLPANARVAALHILVLSYLAADWPRSRDLLPAVLRRYRRYFRPRVLESCMEFAEQAAAHPAGLRAVIQVRPWTVYEICADVEGIARAGEDDWDPGLVGTRRPAAAKAIGRNDPCWCGSGKKYKKCHLESDQSGVASQISEDSFEPNLASSLRSKLVAFLPEAIGAAGLREAFAEFLGDERPREFEQDEQIEFTEWVIWDYVAPALRRTVLEEYLLRRGGRLPPEERRVLEGWARAAISLYRIREVRRNEGVELEDLLRGGRVFVRDRSLSLGARRGQACLVRVLETGDHHEANALCRFVPAQAAKQLREWIVRDRDETGLDWDRYLRANSHRLQRRALLLTFAQKGSGRIVTMEGDPVTFSTATYEVRDPAALLAALDRCSVLRRNEPGESADPESISFTWVGDEGEGGGSDSGARVLGGVRIATNRLILECLSRERLQRGRALLEAVAGHALRHRGDRFTSLGQALRNLPEGPARGN